MAEPNGIQCFLFLQRLREGLAAVVVVPRVVLLRVGRAPLIRVLLVAVVTTGEALAVAAVQLPLAGMPRAP
jgi:hypothetical protein